MVYKNIPKEFLIEEYIKKHKSSRSIAKELKCGETTVFRALEFHKIKRRTPKENNPLFGKEPSKKELTELHHNKHLSINKIAKMHNTSWRTIKRLFDDCKIKTKSHDEIIRPKNYKEPTNEQLIKWYYEENLTTTKIGNILKITPGTVRKLLIRKGIPLKKTIKNRKPNGYWTKEKVIENIKELNSKGITLSARFISLNYGKLFKGALKEFGTWKNAINSTGIDYRTILKQRQWTKQEILNEIKELHKKGVNLSHKNIKIIRKELIWATENNFKSWANAVNESGIDYYSSIAINKNKYWTKENIIKKIKELNSRDINLNSQSMQKSKNRDLFDAAKIKFGSWENAINKAGFDYQKISKVKAQTKSFKIKLRAKLTRDKLQELYVKDSLSTIEIGIMYDVSATTIGNLLKKHNIQLKKPKYGYKKLLECKDGDKVKSNFERNVDDWLYENGIEHENEPRISKKRYFRADFKIRRFYIEVLGMLKFPEYRKKFEEKISYFSMQEGAGFIYCKGEDFHKYKKWFNASDKPIVILVIPKKHKLTRKNIEKQLGFLKKFK
ncbi:MAG: transposase family protein [Candidatus Kuenenbacteria bacterium]